MVGCEAARSFGGVQGQSPWPSLPRQAKDHDRRHKGTLHVARGKAKAVVTGPVEGPWALPDGWRWEQLSKVCYVPERGPPSSRFTHTFRYTDVGGVGDGIEARTLDVADAPSRARQFVSVGDILLSGVRVNLRRTLLVTDNMTDVASTAFSVLRPNDKIIPQFLYYWVKTDFFVNSLLPLQRGSQPPAVLDDDVRAQPIPLPSLDTQQAIVARIDALFPEIDDGEAALARARSDLSTWRKALLKAAVTGELTADWRAANPPTETGAALLARILADRRTRWLADPRNKGKRYVEPTGPDTSALPLLPDNWAWATAGQVVRQTEYGTSTKCTEVPVGPPVLRMGNIQDGGIDWRKLKYAPVDEQLPLLMTGDVLFNRTNSAELLGKSAVFDSADDPVSFASYLVAVRLLIVNPHYFSAWMNSIFGRQWVSENKSQQVGQANLSAGTLMRMPLPVPPLAEQDRIVERVSQSRQGDDELLAEIIGHQTASATLRQSILAAAFRGDLVA